MCVLRAITCLLREPLLIVLCFSAVLHVLLLELAFDFVLVFEVVDDLAAFVALDSVAFNQLVDFGRDRFLFCLFLLSFV